MNKPLGYYTSYVPGDDSYLLQLQQKYGSCLHKLSRREQMFLLYSLAADLCSCECGDVREEVIDTAMKCHYELARVDAEGVCEALINQIRCGNNKETHKVID